MDSSKLIKIVELSELSRDKFSIRESSMIGKKWIIAFITSLKNFIFIYLPVHLF